MTCDADFFIFSEGYKDSGPLILQREEAQYIPDDSRRHFSRKWQRLDRYAVRSEHVPRRICVSSAAAPAPA